MASPHTIERQRGAKEARQQLGVLRDKWPLAFPDRDARPLALGTVGQIAEAMSWSIPYTIGVLTYWKMAPFYCQAVLSPDQRITLDGAPAERASFSSEGRPPTPAGKAMFQMMGVFAEFERAMIRERVRAGLARAVAEGTKLGRPKLDATTEKAIRHALAKGDTGIRKIAARFGVGNGTVQRIKEAMAA
jgi:hypothetical protein